MDVIVGIDPGERWAKDEAGGTPLHEAAAAGSEGTVRELLDGGADTCVINAWGHSPLSVAIEKRHVGIIRLLVDRGALKANYVVKSPFLVRLPLTGDMELFSYVLLRGKGLVDIEDRDEDGRSAFHFALYKGHEKMLFLIVKSGFNINPLFLKSARRGDFYYVKGCIDHGAGLIDVNAADEKGNTALHYAMRNEDAKMAKLLLSAGADATRRNAAAETPAMMSAGGPGENAQ